MAGITQNACAKKPYFHCGPYFYFGHAERKRLDFDNLFMVDETGKQSCFYCESFLLCYHQLQIPTFLFRLIDCSVGWYCCRCHYCWRCVLLVFVVVVVVVVFVAFVVVEVEVYFGSFHWNPQRNCGRLHLRFKYVVVWKNDADAGSLDLMFH